MSIVTLKNTIRNIITDVLEIQYLRATNEEANITLDNLETSTGIGIHVDQTTISTEVSAVSNYRVKIIPTEVLFVFKDITTDDLLDTIDSAVDQAEQLADRFYDTLIQQEIFEDNVALPGYELERLDAYKRFDSILSGVLFTMDVPVRQDAYYCPVPVSPDPLAFIRGDSTLEYIRMDNENEYLDGTGSQSEINIGISQFG